MKHVFDKVYNKIINELSDEKIKSLDPGYLPRSVTFQDLKQAIKKIKPTSKNEPIKKYERFLTLIDEETDSNDELGMLRH